MSPPTCPTNRIIGDESCAAADAILAFSPGPLTCNARAPISLPNASAIGHAAGYRHTMSASRSRIVQRVENGEVALTRNGKRCVASWARRFATSISPPVRGSHCAGIEAGGQASFYIIGASPDPAVFHAHPDLILDAQLMSPPPALALAVVAARGHAAEHGQYVDCDGHRLIGSRLAHRWR
jgi:hypothetical protein